MVVGVCTVQLEIFGNESLKGKRSVVKPILARVRDHFNVAAAEVDDLDAWQRHGRARDRRFGRGALAGEPGSAQVGAIRVLPGVTR